MDELIYSFALYSMLTEIDSTYFPALDPKLLKLDWKTLRKDPCKLTDVYNLLLTNLESWFSIKMEQETIFDSEMISVKRLLRKGDQNELLFLIEFILIVAVKGD